MSGSDTNKVTADDKPNRSFLVEIKKGKVNFKQKCVTFEKQSETLQEIVKFRQMLEERINQQAPPLVAIPDEHKPLIAKLAHESDKTLPTLSKHIHHQLLPTQDEADDLNTLSPALIALPINVVESAITNTMNRNNYGLDGIDGGKVPAAVCVWRWEVKPECQDWLPKLGREKAENRLAERVQAKKDLLAIFEALPQEERDAIFDPKSASKQSRKEQPKAADAPQPIASTSNINQEPSKESIKQMKRKLEDERDDIEQGTTSVKPGRAKKAADPDKAAKEKEKIEKKAAKAEKEQKQKDAQNKSRSIMANFFAKPAPTKNAEANTTVTASSYTQSEFSKVFKPFVLKKDTHLASVNWFLDAKKRKRKQPPAIPDESVIIIDDEEDQTVDDDVEMVCIQPDERSLSDMSAQDRLRSILSSLPRPAELSRPHFPLHKPRTPYFKTHSPLAVRDIISQLSEAEIAGDTSLVRSLLSRLRDRTLLPAKVLIFKDDARPGYFGTWTRNSRIIGPRTPLAKDLLVFDYGYDSGEEWEDEGAGDADDVIEDGEDEDLDGEDVDSDLESWLVDDDDEPELVDENIESPPPNFSPLPMPKRKAEEGEKKFGKRRKVVVPLVPFAKGPCWESAVGQCDYDPFKPYRIQLFNDTPFPIDPFTFVSTCMEDNKASKKGQSSTGGIFVVPSLPERLAVGDTTPTTNPSLVVPSSSVSVPPTTGKRANIVPKNPFPDVHLPYLLTKISSLEAASMTFLVEAIYQELRVHKVKKNAIEAKIREVGEKCKEKKVWIIKSDIVKSS